MPRLLRFTVAVLVAFCAGRAIPAAPRETWPAARMLELQDAQDTGTSCLAALQKLDKAVNIKMTLRDYSTRVSDTRGELEKCLPRVSSGELRREIIAAMDAFLDAGAAWEEMIRFDFMAAEYEPGATFQKKYSIDTSEGATGRIMARAVVLTTIWKEARRRVEKAVKAAGS